MAPDKITHETDEHGVEKHDIIEDNPQLKKPVLTVLGLLADGGSMPRTDLEQAAAELWQTSFKLSPTLTIDVLVRHGALVEQVYIDGEPYAGTLEDAMRDEGIAEDAEASTNLTVTEVGIRLLEEESPEATMSALIDGHPAYAEVFSAILWACDTEAGCSRDQIEAQIAGFKALQPDENGRTHVYPQYFIDALESSGGIAWDGAWRTTEVGRAAAATL